MSSTISIRFIFSQVGNLEHRVRSSRYIPERIHMLSQQFRGLFTTSRNMRPGLLGRISSMLFTFHEYIIVNPLGQFETVYAFACVNIAVQDYPWRNFPREYNALTRASCFRIHVHSFVITIGYYSVHGPSCICGWLIARLCPAGYPSSLVYSSSHALLTHRHSK